MKNQIFLTNCTQIEQIKTSLMLTKSLYVASAIIGQKHIGKKTFIKSVFPEYVFVDARNTQEFEVLLQKHNRLIICNFEYIKNTSSIDFSNKKIIAIINTQNDTYLHTSKFAFVYKMPNLSQRQEDISILSEYYLKTTKQSLMIEKDINLDMSLLDISQNNKSLRASIHKQVLQKTLERQDIENILFDYFCKNLDEKSDYKNNLAIFEKPLIKAGLKKYKSQSKLSLVLGINRNTLRKKINELDIN